MLVADVSRAVIEQIQNGRLSGIERQWIKDPVCNGLQDGTVTSNSVRLQSFRTLFGITGGITSTCVVVFLFRYLYQNRYVVQRISSSSATVWSKIRQVCKHFDGRDPETLGCRGVKEDGENVIANPGVSSGVNPRSSTVVPVSFVEVEMGDVNTDGIDLTP